MRNISDSFVDAILISAALQRKSATGLEIADIALFNLLLVMVLDYSETPRFPQSNFFQRV